MSLADRTHRGLSLALLFIAGCFLVFVSGCAVGNATTNNEPDGKPAATTPSAQLDALQTAPPDDMTDYSQDQFGGWQNTGGHKCDRRGEVLTRDSIPGTPVDHDEGTCTVTKGRWVSLYDGQTNTDARKVTVDHIVPLAEAWRSGASRWDAAERHTFANDLLNLLTVSTTAAKAKGDRGPEAWQPTAGVCDYAQAWIAVKTAWNLTIDDVERTALADMLATCTGGRP